MKEQRWQFWGILKNSFNLYCNIYYLEAHEYEKFNQVFLLSATTNFISLLISFRFIHILLFQIVVCAFIIVGPPRDHLPEECYFWHWAQSHIIHVEEPTATRRSIFLPPFRSFGRKCRLEVSGLLKTVTAKHCPADWPWGLPKQKRHIILTKLVCELSQRKREIIFIVPLKTSSIAK